jgi:hypothetical protein
MREQSDSAAVQTHSFVALRPYKAADARSVAKMGRCLSWTGRRAGSAFLFDHKTCLQGTLFSRIPYLYKRRSKRVEKSMAKAIKASSPPLAQRLIGYGKEPRQGLELGCPCTTMVE